MWLIFEIDFIESQLNFFLTNLCCRDLKGVSHGNKSGFDAIVMQIIDDLFYEKHLLKHINCSSIDENLQTKFDW